LRPINPVSLRHPSLRCPQSSKPPARAPTGRERACRRALSEAAFHRHAVTPRHYVPARPAGLPERAAGRCSLVTRSAGATVESAGCCRRARGFRPAALLGRSRVRPGGKAEASMPKARQSLDEVGTAECGAGCPPSLCRDHGLSGTGAGVARRYGGSDSVLRRTSPPDRPAIRPVWRRCMVLEPAVGHPRKIGRKSCRYTGLCSPDSFP